MALRRARGVRVAASTVCANEVADEHSCRFMFASERPWSQRTTVSVAQASLRDAPSEELIGAFDWFGTYLLEELVLTAGGGGGAGRGDSAESVAGGQNGVTDAEGESTAAAGVTEEPPLFVDRHGLSPGHSCWCEPLHARRPPLCSGCASRPVTIGFDAQLAAAVPKVHLRKTSRALRCGPAHLPEHEHASLDLRCSHSARRIFSALTSLASPNAQAG